MNSPSLLFSFLFMRRLLLKYSIIKQGALVVRKPHMGRENTILIKLPILYAMAILPDILSTCNLSIPNLWFPIGLRHHSVFFLTTDACYF
jgi:hypothetical protein